MSKWFYFHVNKSVCFLLPTIAVGYDTDLRYFIEVGFLFFAVGLLP